jgi:putative nucleotidyltransferase with HDIG domain
LLKKILIVEDDNFFREAIRDILKKKFTVLEAPNGKTAKDILVMQEVDIVLSDIQMPGLTGLELMEWSKEHKPVPFIIMTGFSMVLETKSAFDLGAKGFIAKPFKNNELLAVIDSVLGTASGQEPIPTNEKTQDYCKVSIDEFVAKPKTDFDVYIKLSDSKIIKIAHKGQEIPKDKVTYYKDKGVKHLHILREDFGKLVNFNMNVVKMIKDRPEISKEKKLNFLKYTGEVLLEKTFTEGLDKTSFHEAKSYLDIALDTVTNSDEALDLLTILNSHADFVYAHSLGVSLYSVMIAKKLEYESNIALFKLSLAGFFHDIGKKEIDREILEKPRHLVTREERKLIEGHVVRGQQILNAMHGIPADVVQLVFEHHEDLEGLGYPLGKNKLELHPMARILQAANLFIDSTLLNPGGAHMSGPSAIKHLETIYGNRIDSACIMALKKLFSVSF